MEYLSLWSGIKIIIRLEFRQGILNVTMTIDAVYTWVDGSDPVLKKQLEKWKAKEHLSIQKRISANRYRNWDELRYSLRSLEKFAPWIRRIFIVTADQRPVWLNVKHPKIRLVSHRQIFPFWGRLPCFNSQAIELFLDRICGLSEHFLYFNDDTFLGNNVYPSTFFTDDRRNRVFLSKNTPFPEGETLDTDPLWICSLKNTKKLLNKYFQKKVYFSLHQVQPLRKKTMRLCRRTFKEAYKKTARNRFRSREDITPTLCLHPNYTLYEGQGVAAQISSGQISLTDNFSKNEVFFKRILKNRPQVFFISDETLNPPPETARGLQRFFEEYFPVRSEFEL